MGPASRDIAPGGGPLRALPHKEASPYAVCGIVRRRCRRIVKPAAPKPSSIIVVQVPGSGTALIVIVPASAPVERLSPSIVSGLG